MKHFVLVVLLMVVVYGCWNCMTAQQKQEAIAFIKRHVFRLAVAVIAIALVFAALVQNPSIQLF